jgi:hypothetical protein
MRSSWADDLGGLVDQVASCARINGRWCRYNAKRIEGAAWPTDIRSPGSADLEARTRAVGPGQAKGRYGLGTGSPLVVAPFVSESGCCVTVPHEQEDEAVGRGASSSQAER